MIPAVVRQLTACLIMLGLLCAGAASASAAAPPAPVQPPAAVNLDNAAWSYAPDPRDAGLKAGWQAGTPGPAWRAARLPHVFEPKPEPATFSGTVGWYRLHLTAPPTSGGFGWALRFEQVRRDATVWVDGRKIAHNADPYAPFTVAVPQLADGHQHVILIRVDNRKGPEPREGWWNWGGITRQVTLVPQGYLVAHGSGFMPTRSCTPAAGCSWSVLVDTTIENRGRGVVTPRLAASLTGPGGTVDGTASSPVRTLAPGERARVRFRVPVTGRPQLWAPGHPALYTAALRTVGGTGVQQLDTARIGLRRVTIRHGLLELNGRPVALRGASIQEDVDGHGPALTDADVANIVAQLKAVGANITRAHYALDPRLLAALDAAGIMVWSQAPIYHRDAALRTAAGRGRSVATVRAAVLQTRSHPSVITHSVANELSVQPDLVSGTKAFLDQARAATVDLNPTLPTSVDTLSYPGYTRQATYGAFDLIGINSYFGWYPGKAGHSTASVADLAPYVHQMRAWYPGSALVLTEFGAEATMSGPATEKHTFEFQASYTRDVLAAVGRLPSLSGAIYWTLQEFAVKPNWIGGEASVGLQGDSIHHKGLVTYDGRTKPAWQMLRDDILRTPLQRTTADVELATGIRAPEAHRGRIGHGVAIAIVLLVALLLGVDIWAYLTWREATEAEELDAIKDALVAAGLDDAAEGDGQEPRRHLRLIA
jgi:hypothetical protein